MSDSRWLDEDELATWKSYSLMNLQVAAHLSRDLAREGLSWPDYLVLTTLSDEPDGRRRLVDLARELGWEKSRASHHVSRMHARGLVDKMHCPSDARGTFIVLTDRGRREVARVAPAHVSLVRELFIDQLSARERTTLRHFAERVLAGLANVAVSGDEPRSRPTNSPGA